MKRILVQIYEIQEPSEAGPLIELGVDHIGGVILSQDHWKMPLLRESIRHINQSPSTSILIPLLKETEEILRALDYYEPALVHFCNDIPLQDGDATLAACDRIIRLHEQIRLDFPGIGIVRSLPIPEAQKPGIAEAAKTLLRIASELEDSCDFFMTDTLLGWHPAESSSPQPVEGFVGITGRRCDWAIAAALCRQTRIPVILAGGISPDNVREAVLAVRPAGVDSCTLTNWTDHQGLPVRFRKDPAKVRRLLEEVRHSEAILDC
jgi:phosphoribosylanthranilate isomerase